mgnify:CR=1 FL=1
MRFSHYWLFQSERGHTGNMLSGTVILFMLIKDLI